MYYYTDRRCFPRRISERRSSDYISCEDFDKRIRERRYESERRYYNKGAVYRRYPA